MHTSSQCSWVTRNHIPPGCLVVCIYMYTGEREREREREREILQEHYACGAHIEYRQSCLLIDAEYLYWSPPIHSGVHGSGPQCQLSIRLATVEPLSSLEELTMWLLCLCPFHKVSKFQWAESLAPSLPISFPLLAQCRPHLKLGRMMGC